MFATRFVLAVLLFLPVAASGQTGSRFSPRAARAVSSLTEWMESGPEGEPPVPAYVRESMTGVLEPGVPYAPGQEPALSLLVVTDDPSLLEEAGFHVGTVAGNTVTVEAPVSRVSDLETLPGVEYVRLPMRLSPDLNVSRVEVKADAAHGAAAPPYPGVTGKGVVVGVIDTGLDVDHPDFRDEDGFTRVLRLWDQTDNAGPHPAGFGYGTEWTAADIDGGLIRERDLDGHGTHVTGIVAGNGRGTDAPANRYTYTGMAPEADILFVKTTFLQSSILDAVDWIQSTAGAEPSVVNLSLGAEFGPHDGTDPLDMALESLSGPGRIIVASAGNENGQDIHAEAIVAPGTAVEIPLRVSPYVPNPGISNDLILLDCWYDGSADLRFSVISPNGYTVGPVGPNQVHTGTTGDGTIFIGNALYPVNGDYGVEIDLYDATSVPPAPGVWHVRVQNVGPATGETDCWMAVAYLGTGFSNVRWTGYVDPGETITTPATSNAVLAVGAYVTKTQWSRYGGGTCSYVGYFPIGDIAPFSSLGPRRDGVQKPEISAPGMGIASSLSADAASPLFTSPCVVVTDGVHAVSQGTSQSAPHVAGAVALILEGSPNLDFNGVRDRLVQTARKDNFTGTAWSPAFGHGKLDVAAASVPPPMVLLDLQPGSCPNPLSYKKKGVVPAAVPGTADLDVRDIDVSTLFLEGIAPIRTDFEDVTAPYDGEECACTQTEPDGREDLTLKFPTMDLIQTLQPTVQGDERTLVLTGTLVDGTPFTAEDCVVIKGGPKAPFAPAPGSDGEDADPASGERAVFGLSAGGNGPRQQVTYGLPEAAQVQLTVFDVRGRMVRRLVASPGSPGIHTVQWDASGQASGIYFYRLEAGGRTTTQKFVLIRR